MADNKRFLDLSGLGYFLRKIEAKKANIESPALTGTPTAPTAAKGTNSTQIATTEFVTGNFVTKENNKSLVSDTEITKLSGVSTGANKVESSTTNGNIKIDGTETTVYSHPSTTAVTAAAVKVGKDALGHVIIGGALTIDDIAQSEDTYLILDGGTSTTNI